MHKLEKSSESNRSTANEHLAKDADYNSDEGIAERGYVDTSAMKTVNQCIDNNKYIDEKTGSADAQKSWWES